MTSTGTEHAHWTLEAQELVRFAQRAHRQLGRGFVLCDAERPVYVTWILDAPPALVEAVCEYDPEHEAILVTGDDTDTVEISRLRMLTPN